jgi:16S rRNA (cytosine967-C5)-methyltransferase
MKDRALRAAIALLAERKPGSLQTRLGDLRTQGAGKRARRVSAWTHGALRRRRTLGVVLGAVAKRALKGRPPRTIAILELSAYRLIFEGEALSEVLADLDRLGESKKLRAHVDRVLGALEARIAGREALDAAALGEDDTLIPLSRTEQLRFDRALLGITERRLSTRLGVACSLPNPLVEAWLEAHGEETTRELCQAANDPPSLFLRANLHATTPEALVESLREDEVVVEPTDVAGGLRLGAGRFRSTNAWREGWFSIQDLTAQRVAPLLAPVAGEGILDLCAAPGGKTTHLAELSGDAAKILACDLKEKRLRRIHQNVTRLGLSSIRTQRQDGHHAAEELAFEGPFAGILVDAPCSNTGVVRRRPEARWRYDRRSQARLTGAQRKLLEEAASLLAPEGRLVYSLCSIEPDEGSALVASFLETRPDLKLDHEELWLPSPLGGDGGYAARLVRR